MATKSPRSPGSQFTSKGVVQGTALTSPVDGLPVSVTIDGAGLHRLAVDANLTADNITVTTDDLTPDKDQVSIGDPVTGGHIKVNVDGSIDVNTATSAFTATPDSELIVGTEDGTTTGIKHVVKVNPDGSLAVSFTQVVGTVQNFYNEVTGIAVSASATIITYVVPVATTTYLLRVDVSGTNIATYDVKVNGSNIAKIRTYFSGGLEGMTTFGTGTTDSIKLNTGDTVTIIVTNFRPTIGDFEARLQYIEVP